MCLSVCVIYKPNCAIMDLCRTCLKTPAKKDVSELEKGLNEENKNHFDIMVFCLDIEVVHDSKITTKLCSSCYRKIISFYKFKVLSLKNDAYLKSINPVTLIKEQNLSVYVDENGIKYENPLENDEYGLCLVEDNCEEIKTEVKKEYVVEIELKSEESLLSLAGVQNNVKEAIAPVESRRASLPVAQIGKPGKIKKNNKEKVPKKCGLPRKLKHSKQEYQVCEECGKSVRNMNLHAIMHRPKEERKMVPCKALNCPKKFYTRRGMKNHYKFIHLGVKHKCDICDKEVANIKAHKKVVHENAALPYACVTCARRFLSQYALDVHMTSHTQVCEFECDVCQKKFRGKALLRGHIRLVHEKERKFQCEYCPKSFFTKALLRRHIRSHTNERPYKCEDCDRTFTLSDTLKSHRLIHANVKKYHCELCDKSFIKPGYLKSHMISHTKEKRYPCGYCDVRFGRSDHRKRHEFTAHQKQRSAD